NFKTGNYLEERYQYDNRNRLLERKNPKDVTYYQYDKQGNTVSELTKQFLKPETTKVQQADGRTLVSNSLAKTELEQYKTYEYNAFNQASKVVVENYQENSKEIHVQENFYDAENLRYGIEEDGERTNFVTNGWSVCTELDAEWKPTKRLVRGYGIVASDEIGTATITDVGSGYSNGYRYYHQNEHGDIEYITGKDGKVENAYTYDAFGNITNSTELVKNRYTYNGEQYDQVTQQYYLRARYYNPLVGRFTQEDVYRGDGLNLYAYCGNNPVMYVDPSGYSKKCGTGSESGKNSDYMFGENGTQFESKTTWKNGKTERIDIENPAPGERPGQIHYHEPNNTKWYLDVNEMKFYNQKTREIAPKSIQNILKNKDVIKAINKGLKFLGE
ncbi:MAG: RHS repeat-associated core domain-containing protein, partial [Lachnospiraceae bacterium]|nr:RHS repeat-associated core domain-containing protein [Lachnospiraceae bacterium]